MTNTRGNATVDRSDYNAYIRSSAWRAVRKRYIASKLPKICAGCKTPWGAGDHLHHRTYKNLGNERLMDLVPLCQPCHVKVHALYDSDPKYRRKGLWYTTKVALRQPKVRKSRPARKSNTGMGVVHPKRTRADWPGLRAPVKPPSFQILPPQDGG